MRIVHVCRQFRPGIGGLETVIDCLSREQVAAGHQVRVVTLDSIFHTDVKLPAEEAMGGVEVRRVRWWGSTRYPIAPAVIKHIKDADIVHIHGVDFILDYLALTKILHKKPLVLSTHGGFFHTAYAAGFKKLFFNVVTRTSLRAVGYVLASSDPDREMFSSIRDGGMRTVVNGVSVDRYLGLPVSDERRLIYFGRLAPNKNIAAVFPVLSALRDRHPDWTMVVAGKPMGVTVEELRAEAARCGVGDAVAFHNTPSDDELLRLVASSSFYVSASLYEGFGIAPIEAIAGGLTPILSDIKPHRDTIEATGAGMVTSFDDPRAVADGIDRLWSERVALEAATREQRRRSTLRYGWAPMASETEAIYRCVLGNDARRILGLRLECLDADRLVDKVAAGLAGQGSVRLAFANANLLNLAADDPAFRKELEGFTIANDGIGVDIASKVLYGKSFPENLNGTDFCPYLLDHLAQPTRIFLYGGRPDVNERAAAEFARRWPRHSVVGWQHGFHKADEEAVLVERIRASGAELVLVALGNPRQEQWIARNSAKLPAVAIGVGALFDFLVGIVPRAPEWVQKARMEWVFRLVQEPGRLWRRYILGNPKFLWHVTRQYFNGVRA